MGVIDWDTWNKNILIYMDQKRELDRREKGGLYVPNLSEHMRGILDIIFHGDDGDVETLTNLLDKYRSKRRRGKLGKTG